MSRRFRIPRWLQPGYPCWDLPLLAVAWLHLFAEGWRLYLPWPAYVSLGLAAWVLRVGARALETSMTQSAGLAPDPRQEFHLRHRKLFRAGVAVASAAALFILVAHMPKAIYINLCIAGVLVGGYFGLLMLSPPDPPEAPLLKNVMGGIAFAFGIAIIAHTYRSEFGLDALLQSRDFLCFTLLCILHACALELWKHAARSADLEIRARDELALTLPLAMLALFTLIFALQDEYSRPFYYSILTGAALLHLLNRRRSRYPADALRALATASMLAPVPVFFLLRSG